MQNKNVAKFLHFSVSAKLTFGQYSLQPFLCVPCFVVNKLAVEPKHTQANVRIRGGGYLPEGTTQQAKPFFIFSIHISCLVGVNGGRVAFMFGITTALIKEISVACGRHYLNSILFVHFWLNFV